MSELHQWWESDPAERYWMEITGRPDLGDDLHSPKHNKNGEATGAYALMTTVSVGDIVLHWHQTLRGVPALVGWSRVAASPVDDEILWQARGTASRYQKPSIRPAWRTLLADFTPLLEPVSLEDARAAEVPLREVTNGLTEKHGSPLYLPYVFSPNRPLRAAQGYLAKFPAAFLDVLGIDAVPVPDPTAPQAARRRAGSGGLGRQADPRVRDAIEQRAVDVAIEEYTSRGYAVQDLGKWECYDLTVSKDGEERRVEIKGSSGEPTHVELTVAEVENARTFAPTDLFVVSGIEWTRLPDGSVVAEGGSIRRFDGWEPAEAVLVPTRYRYALPFEPGELTMAADC